jgi:ferrochelatase
VLLVNLGTPDAPTATAVRRYLGEFLWDPRVVELPRPLWWLILHGVILRFRPARVAGLYRKVWTDEGAPLLCHSKRLTAAVEGALGGDVRVALAMRYGQPSIERVLGELRAQGMRRLLVLPLYPQYSATTTAAVFDAVSAVLARWRWVPELRFIQHYHDHPAYIDALARSIAEHRQAHGSADRLLMSFHGIPLRYFNAGDPYFCECQKTARLLADRLGLEPDQWKLTFQSRFGREQWLKPYTDHTLREWPGQGVRSVDLVCPGFASDCLETLEEIDEENREIFVAAGGESFNYIPALNDRPDHAAALAQLLKAHLQGWDTAAETPHHRSERLERAKALGAVR